LNISVSFEAEKLPVAYRLAILSLVKECVKQGDEKAYQSYFGHRGPKPFAFSVYLNGFKLTGDQYHISGFQLNLSSSDYGFLIPFLNGLQKTKIFQYKHYTFQRNLIHYLNEHVVRSSSIMIRTLSPILVEDADHRPLSPFDAAYNDELNQIMNRIASTLQKRPLIRPIRLAPISVKKSVIRESNETFEKAKNEHKTKSDFLYYTAYTGRFVLEGDPSDLNWMLQCGIGLRSSQGFGHFTLESEVKS